MDEKEKVLEVLTGYNWMSSRFGGAGCYETCENLWVTIKFGDFV
jgi:hypothetical protein